MEVLTFVTQGLTYKEVGTKLFLAEHTINYPMGEVIERLHLENRRQVRMMGIEVLLECSEGRFHLNAQGAGFRSGESISDALRV